MATSRFQGWNSAFLYICFIWLLVTCFLASHAQATVFTVDPEVQKRKGGLLDSKKKSLILAGKVFFHQSYHPMVLQGGKYREDADYDHIAVCEGSQSGTDLAGNPRLFTYFACPMDDRHTGGFAKLYCCKEAPAQECCNDSAFGFEHDKNDAHKRMIKIVIIVCSVIGGLILICFAALVTCCLCGVLAVCGCCKRSASGGRVVGAAASQTRAVGPGMSGGSTIGQYPTNQTMAYQNTVRPPPQQLNYAANQQPAGYQQSYQPANQQPAGYQQSYQPANQQPASYQQSYRPANQQPPSYQPANQQPPSYQPSYQPANQASAPYPATANQEKSTPYPS